MDDRGVDDWAHPHVEMPICHNMSTPARARDPCPTRLTCRLRFAHQHQYLASTHPRMSNEDLRAGKAAISSFNLYLEVISRGGHAKVSMERKWTEIATAIGFLHNNSGSFLKQKYEDKGLAHVEMMDPALVEECLDYGPQNAGARSAALPPRAITPIEQIIFPEFAKGSKPEERERYLDARNHVLQRWALVCDRPIEYEGDIRLPLMMEFGEITLKQFPLRRAFFIMETLGYMNWGCFDPSMALPASCPPTFVGGVGNDQNDGTKKKKIVILGAGLSGLACACQLKRFGHDVVVIEGRDRVGGRVHTDTSTFSQPVDLGAMLITGVQGHPASVLTHQLRQRKYAVGDECPIYSLGETLDEETDRKVEARFNSMLTAAAVAMRRQIEQSSTATLPAVTAAALVAAPLPAQGQGAKKRARVGKVSSHGLTPMLADSPDFPTSKYSGVSWNPDMWQWTVTLTKQSSGAIVYFSGRRFYDELPAALAHDEELRLAQKRGDEIWSDFRNQDAFPDDFVGIAPFDPEIDENKVKIKSGTPASRTAQEFGAGCLTEAQTEIDRLKFHSVSTSFTNSSRKRTDVDDAPLLEKMLEEDEAIHFERSEQTRMVEDAFLGWHLANLEYACATSLSRISAANWDQDDEHDWEGSHVMLPNGFGALTEGMRRSLLLQAPAGDVVLAQLGNDGLDQMNPEYHNGAVQQWGLGNVSFAMKTTARKIRVQSAQSAVVVSDRGEEIQGDAVVCSVSLGVLKDVGSLTFDPPLPVWKTGAIDRLGFGNLNKVTFEFDHVFWSKNHDIFGRVVHPHVGSRGECYMYWALNKLYETPILLALCAGDAADEQEYRDDETVVMRAMNALRETFPHVDIPNPKAYAVTRWRSDPFSRGTYSYIDVGSSGEDYNLMAEEIPGNVHFAGEATCREHPATTGGALLSGLREAAKLAAKFGRVVDTAGEGDTEECNFALLLKRVTSALSMDPMRLSQDKLYPMERIMSGISRGQIMTPCDADAYFVNRLQTEGWFHAFFPSNFLKTNRERALRAAEILPRLPVGWDEKRKHAYLAERLGYDEWKEGEQVGVWI